MGETTKRRSDGGRRIIEGLDEALAWAKGQGSAFVTLPGKPGQQMTREQYEMEMILRRQEEDAPRLLPKRRDRL